MTYFTDNPLEKLMTQKPGSGRQEKPPLSISPACGSCPYKTTRPCIGYCIRKLQGQAAPQPET